MARQINLVNPSLRKTHDALSALPLSIAVAVLVVLVIIAASIANLVASRRHAEAEALAANQKQAQTAFLEASRRMAMRKPDPHLAAELDRSRLLVERQQQILQKLDDGSIGNSQGFAEFLRGFARQVPKGLWLTGFTLSAGGTDMEVRGRMLSPTLLPEYVGRLNAETVFRGRSFAGLEIQSPRGTGQADAATAPPGFTEFVLTSAPPKGPR
jgi:hypothetical protein